MGRDRKAAKIERQADKFQSTRPRGARHAKRNAISQRGFNPRARVGRDTSVCSPTTTISCFNPRARVGRDLTVSHDAPPKQGFNPRARVGRDSRNVLIGSELCGFNPRARVGRDPDRVGHVVQIVVSIHAPAWGATTKYRRNWRSNRRFNPRARVGRDAPSAATSRRESSFQSTRPRGARPSSMEWAVIPRMVSIHAPAWGATVCTP